MNSINVRTTHLGSYKARRVLGIVAVVMMVAVMTMSVAFATSAFSNIEEGITKGTQQMYNLLLAIVMPVAAVCFAWNGFKALFGGEKGMESAKKNMFTIILVLALVYLAPLAIEQVAGWFSSSTGSSFWN